MDGGGNQDRNNNDDDEVVLLYNQLRSSGYSQMTSRAMVMTQIMLRKATSKLLMCNEKPPRGVLHVGISAFDEEDHPDMLLPHNDILLPYWKRFTDELSSRPFFSDQNQGYINLIIQQLEVEDATLSRVLLQSIKSAPIYSLSLKKNGLDVGGLKFVMKALKSSNTIESLALFNNPFRSPYDAADLVRAAVDHPRLVALLLYDCSLGHDDDIMWSIAPALNHLREVGLCDNSLGSFGARMISNCLSENPTVAVLHLEGNLFNDADARSLAKSLKKNSNLRKLNIGNNRITRVGIRAFHLAVFNYYSLRSLLKSNHTCWIVTEQDVGVLPLLNRAIDARLNRKLKIWRALVADVPLFDNISTEMVPRLMTFVQEWAAESYQLTALYKIMRRWKMPCLYTSCASPARRRSKRIREQRVAKMVDL